IRSGAHPGSAAERFRAPERVGFLMYEVLIVACLIASPADCKTFEAIGRAHVLTPFTNAYLVCRLLLDKYNFFFFSSFFFLFFFMFSFFSFFFFFFFYFF